MECYLCGGEPAHQCPRCRRLYCDEHGGEYCADCLSPASGLPSSAVYRGSILALLAGTVVAIWLMVRTDNNDKQSATTIIVTPSPAVSRTVAAKPTRTPGGATPVETAAAETPTPGAENGTPTGEETGTPEAGRTPASAREYTVHAGDTLFDIAGRLLPPGDNLDTFINAIAAANGLDPQNPEIVPGQVLQIPR